MSDAAAVMRYYSGSAGDLDQITIRKLYYRLLQFQKVHKGRMKFDASLAGAKFE